MKRNRDDRLPQRMAFIAGVMGIFATSALPGCAPQPFADDGLTKRSASVLGAATIPAEPKPFVRDQRQASPEYIPVGVTPPQRELRPRDAGAASALEAELDAQRRRSQEFATRPQPKATYDGSIPPRPAPPPKELLPQ
jgi:hypothetical protein